MVLTGYEWSYRTWLKKESGETLKGEYWLCRRQLVIEGGPGREIMSTMNMILKYCLCLWKSVKISLDDNTNEPVQLFFERCKFHVSGSIKMFTFYTGIGSWTSKMFWFLNSIYIRNLPSLVLSLMERCIIWLYSLYMYSIQHLKQNIENIRENHNFWFNIWYFMQHLVRTNRTMILALLCHRKCEFKK